MSDVMAGAGGDLDLEGLANPQPIYKALRDAGPVVEMDDIGMVIVGGDAEVRHVLQHPEVFSSGIDAVEIGQVRPLIPLQIDPPHHKNFRKLLDPIFAPKQVALLEDRTRALVRELIAKVGVCELSDELQEAGLRAGDHVLISQPPSNAPRLSLP